MVRKQTYVIRIKTNKQIDLAKVDRALKSLDKDYELEGFEKYRPIKF